jgi:maltooligosyltrehalose trehalohydrolase
MPLGSLGAIEANGVVSFGLWLPWVSATHSNVVTVKIIHEADQFLQGMPPREFRLAHSVRPPYGRLLVSHGSNRGDCSGEARLRLG